MANEEHLENLRKGVEEWNRWREEHLGNDNGPADLRDADLRDADLCGANLSRAGLSNADLRGANLRGANLVAANLSNANLSGANLTKANMRGASLGGAKLIGTDLRGVGLSGAVLNGQDLEGTHLQGADLKNADLLETKSLFLYQLAGADLTNATLPNSIGLAAPLGVIKDSVGYARKLFLALLLACAYSILTVMTTTDASLVTNQASSPLPIIGASVSMAAYYTLTPILLVSLYVYFLVSMQRIWERLSQLPAVFPDGRAVDDVVDPWLLLGFMRHTFDRLRLARRKYDVVQLAITIILQWWMVPFTVFAMGFRYRYAHALWITIWHFALSAIVCLCAFRFLRDTFSTLLSISPLAEGIEREWWYRFRGVLFHLLAVAIPLALFVPSQTNLVGEVLSTRPSNYYALSEEMQMRSVTGPELRGKDLRDAKAFGVFAVRARLEGADLRRADLRRADLREADLRDTNLHEAILIWADLRKADLSKANLSLGELSLTKAREARLCGTNLREARLRGADLRGADLREEVLYVIAEESYVFPPRSISTRESEQAALLQRTRTDLFRADLSRADLREADLSGANLREAILAVANLSGASLLEADLRGTMLYRADLSRADLSGVDLTQADLRGANLIEVSLRGANLTRANLRGADLSGAILRWADLREARFLTPEQLADACGDAETKLPEGFEMPDTWPCKANAEKEAADDEISVDATEDPQ